MIYENIEKAKELAKEYKLKAEFIIHKESGKTTQQAEDALGVDSSNILKTLILYASKEELFFGAINIGCA